MQQHLHLLIIQILLQLVPPLRKVVHMPLVLRMVVVNTQQTNVWYTWIGIKMAYLQMQVKVLR